MPCKNGSIDSNIDNMNQFEDIIANLSEIAEESKCDTITFGGDLNANIMENNTPHSVVLNDFLTTYKMSKGQKLAQSVELGTQIGYTFANEKLARYSQIEFLCISNILKNCVDSYDHLESPLNHSDHLAVSIGSN